MEEQKKNYKSQGIEKSSDNSTSPSTKEPSTYHPKWLGQMHPLPPPRTSQGNLKGLFPEMDDPKYQRAIGMLTAILLALDEGEKRGVLSYKGHLYPCVFAHRKFMQQFGDKIGKEITIGVWPTLYARLPQTDGRKKKTLILRVKGLRPEVQDNGYFEVRGIVEEIESNENKIKVSIKEQNRKLNYMVRIYGNYSGREGDLVVFECHLEKGLLVLDAWKLLEQASPNFLRTPDEPRPHRYSDKPPSRPPSKTYGEYSKPYRSTQGDDSSRRPYRKPY